MTGTPPYDHGKSVPVVEDPIADQMLVSGEPGYEAVTGVLFSDLALMQLIVVAASGMGGTK